MELSVTAEYIGGTAVVLTATGVIWRKAIRPVIIGIHELVTVVPVIHEIAEQFKPDSGTSLKDVIDGIHDGMAATSLLAEAAKDNAAHATLVAQNAVTKVEAFESYVHDRFHEFANSLTVIRGATIRTREGEYLFPSDPPGEPA